MLIEMAIADSYGAGREYANPAEVGPDYYDPAKFISHQKWLLPPGLYTDDTAMAVAVAEVLFEKGFWATKMDFANKFVDLFKRDLVDGAPRKGYAAHFYDFMLTVKDGEDMLARIKPESDKSGAAMRAAPLGIIRSLELLLKTTKVQAQITHDTQDGIEAAQASALMSHYCIYNLGKREDVGSFVENILGDRLKWNVPWVGKIGAQGWHSVRAAITAIKDHDNLLDMTLRCVDFEGDVDTAAAIAVGAAASHPEVRNEFPKSLYDTMEDGTYGRAFLEQLDKKLFALKSP